jgi:hypothetical protein
MAILATFATLAVRSHSVTQGAHQVTFYRFSAACCKGIDLRHRRAQRVRLSGWIAMIEIKHERWTLVSTVHTLAPGFFDQKPLDLSSPSRNGGSIRACHLIS